MNHRIRFLPNGTVTSVQGFEAGATFAGMKTYAEDKLDLGILYAGVPCACAGVFTTNQIKSPSIVLTRKHVRKGTVRAVVANSGIANTSVGDPGRKDADEVTRLAAAQLGLLKEEVGFLSTGIIGVELPMALIRTALPKIQLSSSGGSDFARAIMTTDTHPKELAVAYDFGGRTVTIGGVAKGSGMIHPNMATMLCVVATDARVGNAFLQRAIRYAADHSFNMITIDGDSSTNDTLMILANGVAGGPTIDQNSEEANLFQEALKELCIHLAKDVVRDGEGASKLFQVSVEGARTDKEARLAARTIAGSSLVKTAVHGNDPNWGRIAAALGRSGARVQEDKLALYVNDVCIMEDGLPVPFFKDAIVMLMRNPEVFFRIDLHLGNSSATAWGCNLSEAYVTFNSAYTT
ncbi:bifunctional glutamate N-acetyltransferase/amino-acid acetyltransferase ArgJ [Dehalococcoidia bacterium]|nr:bifunctional glutamate N-acetyltransferase/amino-acid acetyltransferase ArgJ [Dehalococcoidia bacterium]